MKYLAQIVMAGLVIVCLLGVPLWQAVVLGLAGDTPGCFLLSVSWLIWFVVSFTIHEIGHLVFGRLMKLEPRELVLGLVRWKKEPSGWMFQWNRQWNQGSLWVGFHLPLGNRMKFRNGVMLVGGPLTSLAVSLVLLVFARYFYDHPPLGNITPLPKGFQSTSAWFGFLWFPGNRFTAFLIQGALIGLYFGLGTLLPGVSQGRKTDGLQLWELWTQNRVGEIIVLDQEQANRLNPFLWLKPFDPPSRGKDDPPSPGS